MKDYVLVKLSGGVADSMCKVNSRYNPFVAMGSGKKVLYMRLMKASYGCM